MAGECGDERRAQIGVAGAAIRDEERHQRAQTVEVGTVDDRPALALGPDQAGARQDGKVGGHGILRNVELAGDLARGEAGGRVADEQAEDVEARRLRERRQRRDGLIGFHISNIVDIMFCATVCREAISPPQRRR